MGLEEKIERSYEYLDALDPSLEYILAFSGGKDSHVLLGLYLEWCRIRGKQLKAKVVFSDTGLEVGKLYNLIECVDKALKGRMEFVITKPPIDKTYWVVQFGYGYPVPTYRNRWCTNNLKVRPMRGIQGLPLTGVHKGESKQRDKRLSCSQGECGITDINGLAPLQEWRNCDVWDYITIYLDDILYQGCCDNIMSLYEISESTSGSLRMGCFHCPVVVTKRIEENITKGIVPSYTTQVRQLLEELRGARRIHAPNRRMKSGDPMPGSIYIEDRRAIWSKLSVYKERLVRDGFMTDAEYQLTTELLAKGAYPKTYPQEWILSEHERLVG